MPALAALSFSKEEQEEKEHCVRRCRCGVKASWVRAFRGRVVGPVLFSELPPMRVENFARSVNGPAAAVLRPPRALAGASSRLVDSGPCPC